MAPKDNFNTFILATITIFLGANPAHIAGRRIARIFGVREANQSAPSTLSTVVVYTNIQYLIGQLRNLQLMRELFYILSDILRYR